MTAADVGFHALLYACNRVVNQAPSHRLRLAFYRQAMRFQIGPDSHVFMGAWFDTRRNFVMGRSSVINQGCRLDNRGGIRIGDNTSLSADVCVLTADHDLRDPDGPGRTRPVHIGDYVFVGTRATILPGVTIGRGAAVAAAAVVTRDVPPNTIVAGSPARPIGDRTVDFKYTARYRRLFQ